MAPDEVRRWENRRRRIQRFLTSLCGGYFFIVLVVCASILTWSALSREDISFTIEDFSIFILPDSEGLDYPFFFEGIVPLELKDSLAPGGVKFVKLYFSPSVYPGNGNKFTLRVQKAKIGKVGEAAREDHQPSQRGMVPVVGMRAGIFSARLSRFDIGGRDLVKIVRELPGTDVVEGFDKSKLILGETSVLNFWMKRLFSSSPLFKEMGQLVD